MNKRLQNGAVWIEFLVASSTILVSLFFLVPMLGKYMDIRHTTESAARYAAWERTVWYGPVGDYGSSNRKYKLATEIENESNHRVLSSGKSLIYGTQKNTSELANFNFDALHYFNNHSNSQYETILEKKPASPESSNQYFTLSENESEAPKFNTIDTGLNTLGALLNGGVPVERAGYYRETVNILAKTPSWMGSSQYIEKSTPFTEDTQTFSASNSILVDGWGAGGKADNIDRVRDMKAKNQESLLNFHVNAMKIPYSLFYPFVKELWDIDVEKIDVELLLDETHLGQY